MKTFAEFQQRMQEDGEFRGHITQVLESTKEGDSIKDYWKHLPAIAEAEGYQITSEDMKELLGEGASEKITPDSEEMEPSSESSS